MHRQSLGQILQNNQVSLLDQVRYFKELAVTAGDLNVHELALKASKKALELLQTNYQDNQNKKQSNNKENKDRKCSTRACRHGDGQ